MQLGLHELPITSLVVPRDNVRRHVGELDELSQSIKEVGLLEPIIATPLPGGKKAGNGNGNADKVLIVAGTRRLMASKKAGLKTVPTIVRKYTEVERVLAMAVENLQREDLTTLEEAHAYGALRTLGLDQREIAQRTGRSQPVVQRRLALLALPKDALDQLESGRLSLSNAQEFARLAKYPDRLKKVLKDTAYGNRGYNDVSRLVDRELDAVKVEEKVASETAKLKKAKVALVAWPTDGMLSNLPKGVRPLEQMGDTIVDAKEHAKLPCHAATISPRDGTVILLCTDPAKHPEFAKFDKKHHLVNDGKAIAPGPGNRAGSGTRTTTGMTAAQKKAAEAEQRKAEKRKAHERDMQKAKHERWQFIRKLLSKRIAKPLALEELVFAMIEQSGADTLKKAGTFLAVEPVKSQGFDHWDQPLREKAKKNEADLHRVALALAFATWETRMNGGGWTRWDSDEDVKAHLELLKEKGYAVSKAEQAELDGKAPQRTF